MGIADKLAKLSRIVPGVAGYQDREAAQDTDKKIRMRLGDDLERLKKDLEDEKRYYMDAKNLEPLPALDRMASRIDKIANLLIYASRGYRGFFDRSKPDLEKLERLYSFDLSLFGDLESLRPGIAAIRSARSDPSGLMPAVEAFASSLDRFERAFSDRQGILDNR